MTYSCFSLFFIKCYACKVRIPTNTVNVDISPHPLLNKFHNRLMDSTCETIPIPILQNF